MLDDLKARFEEASAQYAAANGFQRDADWFILKMHEEMGELTQIWNKLSGRGRRRGLSGDELRQALANETADLLGHVLLFAKRNDLDLSPAIKRKWHFQPEGGNG